MSEFYFLYLITVDFAVHFLKLYNQLSGFMPGQFLMITKFCNHHVQVIFTNESRLLLKYFTCLPTREVSIPSIDIVPSMYANLNKADINDDLPAPVLPTIPT